MLTTIICTPARKLMAAALALTGCRILSEWDSILACSVALLVLFTLVASLIAGMPRLRRMSIVMALPVTTVANSVLFALGAFIVLLGAKGYLPNGSIGGRGPLWNWNFTVVPLVAATNVVAMAWPSLASRWRRGVWLANMASAAYALRFWDVEDDYSRMLGIPMSFESILLIALAVLSLAVTTWDAREGRSLAAPRRRKWAVRSGCVIVGLLWLSLWPVYAKRQIVYSLKSYGLSAFFGMAFPGWQLPFDLPFEWYDYLGEVTGADVADGLTGDDAIEAGRVLNTLPWLEIVVVNESPLDGGRILKPLAGHKRLSQIALKGAGATDETLADAARLPALNRAVFEEARISDEGLVHLANARWLQTLAIRRTPISGDGLRHLKLLPRLSELDLRGTNFGDRQAALLTQLKMLTQLSLNDTNLSDEGLALFGHCKGLRLLEISETRVTAGGVERLRRALPGCNVVWQPPLAGLASPW